MQDLILHLWKIVKEQSIHIQEIKSMLEDRGMGTKTLSRYVSVNEACERLGGIHRNTLTKYINQGLISCKRFGNKRGRILIREFDITHFKGTN